MQKGRICNACKSEIDRSELDKNYSICPRCGYYMRFHAKKRILSLADKNSFHEWESDMKWSNAFNDSAYEQKLIDASKKHTLNEAIIIGEMIIGGERTAIGVMDTRFMMASMGHVVGEKVVLLFEKALKKKLPVILFCCSGGARMQEGIISLMQMEKTSAAVARHSEAGLLYVSVLTNPTMGGVTASFAMLADIVFAEREAMIGFAGRRVIEQNTGEKLPEDFQTAEFQRRKGFIDAIVEREKLRELLLQVLKLHTTKNKKAIISRGKVFDLNMDSVHQNRKRSKCSAVSATYAHRQNSAWDRVKIARSKDRPTTIDYINGCFENFFEFSGDRVTGDDPAIVAGIAEFHGYPVTVMGHQKGKQSVEDALYRNWGMASPQGYRKVLRLIRQAEKFHRPVICFIDTIGAACGKEAEEQGQGAVIANLLAQLSTLKTPVLSIVIGEGGSGGALALGVGNEVWMLENAIYSVLSPEGYASILWKDNSRAKEAAEMMHLEAEELYHLGIIDKVIPEVEPITNSNIKTVCGELERNIHVFLIKYMRMNTNKLVEERYQRFRKY